LDETQAASRRPLAHAIDECSAEDTFLRARVGQRQVRVKCTAFLKLEVADKNWGQLFVLEAGSEESRAPGVVCLALDPSQPGLEAAVRLV
jgi:hypothetical protein